MLLIHLLALCLELRMWKDCCKGLLISSVNLRCEQSVLQKLDTASDNFDLMHGSFKLVAVLYAIDRLECSKAAGEDLI